MPNEGANAVIATLALVGRFEFTEWMPDNHLQHSRFIALRDDKKPKEVVREG